jgi:NAD dependent epimerase/dehydratase family enzyme
MASETFLSSERVIPQRLLESGFTFKYPRLIEALAAIFHKELQQQIGA